MLKVVTAQSMIDEMVKNQITKPVAIFQGSMEDNRVMAKPSIYPQSELLVKMKTPKWEGSEAYASHWNAIKTLRDKMALQEVQNVAHTPEDLSTLIQLFFVDVTRRTMELQDFTSMLTDEITNYEFPESISLRDIYPFRTKFGEIGLAGDSVPLVQQNSGAVGSVIMKSWGTGWKGTLHNLLFNTLFSLQKVMQAVAEAHILDRNRLGIGQIFAATFVASQKVPASADADLSYDENLYNTWRAAYKLLKSLKDPQNKKPIATPQIVGLVHSTRRWESERVIRGALETTRSGDGRGRIYSPLPINELWEYDGMSYTYGKETVSFAGCDPDKAYLFVPKTSWYTMVKRPLTMEVGRGNVLQLSTEERAWYYTQIGYNKDFLGSSYPAAVTTSEGFIVEIEMPTDEYDT